MVQGLLAVLCSVILVIQFVILISNEILSFEARTLRVLAVLRTASSHTKLDALRAIKNESFLTSFSMK